jgi:ribonuclease HI
MLLILFSFEQAAIAALKQIEADKPVELRTDSHYVMKGTRR